MLTVTQTTTLYCLFGACLSDASWAAWVQAIGSAAAIAFSIYIVNRQHRLENKRRETASREERAHRLRSARELLASVRMRLWDAGAQLASPNSFRGFWESWRWEDLQTGIEAIQTFPLDRIDHGPLLFQFVRARRSAETVLTLVTEAGAGVTEDVKWQRLHVDAEKLCGVVDKSMKAFDEEIKLLLGPAAALNPTPEVTPPPGVP